jgi:DNA-binding NarL/FixJ family response regulator
MKDRVFYLFGQTNAQITSKYTNMTCFEPICFVCSHHPLAISLINNVLSSDPGLRDRTRAYSPDESRVIESKQEILILDTCSVPKWNDCLQDWKKAGGTIIALVSSESLSTDLELHLLNLGASGILTFSDSFCGELLRAVHAVAAGQAWIRHELLNIYVNWNRWTARDLVSDQRLTTREKQILDLLQSDLSNRTIAQKLAISERTIKFHVSNILHKLSLTNRRELRSFNDFSCAFPARASLSVVSKVAEASGSKQTLRSA